MYQAALPLDQGGSRFNQRRIFDTGRRDLLGIVVQPLDLHLVNAGSIPTGPTHGEGRLQPHPEDVLNPPRMSGRAPDQA